MKEDVLVNFVDKTTSEMTRGLVRDLKKEAEEGPAYFKNGSF